MQKEQIILTLELYGNTEDFDCEVEFTFTHGVDGVYHAAPEHCYPSEPAEWKLHSLWVEGIEANYLIKPFNDEIIRQLITVMDL